MNEAARVSVTLRDRVASSSVGATPRLASRRAAAVNAGLTMDPSIAASGYGYSEL
jgi:hypothetical protein